MAASLIVRDAMSSDLVVAQPEMLVHAAMDLMLAHEVSALPVVDAHGALVGLVTERDCMDAVFEADYYLDLGRTVAEVMAREIETLEAGSDIVAAIDRFRTSTYRRFPVLHGARLVGVLSRRDVLRALRAID